MQRCYGRLSILLHVVISLPDAASYDKLNYVVEFENDLLSYDINNLALLTNIRTCSCKTIAAKYTYQRK